MADKSPLKATYNGSDTNGLAEFASGDTVAIADGGTGATTASGARTALGVSPTAGSSSLTTLGTVATGTWEATDVAVAHGGTGASTASEARTNLGITDTTPGGSNTEIQYNNSGSFGASANLTFDGSTLLVGTSIAATADTNTSIGLPGSDVLTLNTGGSERVRISSVGSIELNNPGDATRGIHFSGNQNGLITTNESFYFNIDSDNGQTDRIFRFGKDAATTSGTAIMDISEGGYVGIGNTAMSTYANAAVGLVIGDTSDATSEITIATSTSGTGELNFTDTADTTNQFSISATHGTGMKMDYQTALFLSQTGTDYFKFESTGLLRIWDDANANMSTGITINQKTNDDQIFALKSSDVTHGMTDVAETDTYAALTKRHADYGGLDLHVYTESISQAFMLHAVAGSEDTNDTTTSASTCHIMGKKANGTNVTAVGSTANIFSIANDTTTRVIIKGDGTVHASDTSWATSLDDMPDALAGRAYTTEMARRQGAGLLGGMEVDAPELVQRMEDAGIVTHAEKEGEGHIPGHRFLNVQKGIKFSWDMGFQNFKWMYEMAKVLSDDQRAALPEDMQSAFAALEANESQFIQEKN